MSSFILKNLISAKFSDNPPDRCYYCKKELFKKIKQIAQQHHLNAVLDGSNADDRFDYRPGAKARKELGVRSPLYEVGLTKQEIRDLSNSLHLKSSEKPPLRLSCLPVPLWNKNHQRTTQTSRSSRRIPVSPWESNKAGSGTMTISPESR